MTYFTADLHFGHANIIKHCNRPFATAEEMDEALIANWNNTVTVRDEVYILGDLTMLPALKAHEYLTRLNGRKYFIRGNHDKFLKGFEQYESDFDWIKDYFVLRTNTHRLVLFHFPIIEWDQYYRGAIHLYGHVHNSATSAALLQGLKGLAFNVGVDVNEFKPVSITEIIKRSEMVIHQV